MMPPTDKVVAVDAVTADSIDVASCPEMVEQQRSGREWIEFDIESAHDGGLKRVHVPRTEASDESLQQIKW